MKARECQFCGSTACEWEHDVQLGCTDCGYELPDVPTLEKQVQEDTCGKHRVWLCTKCFDFTPVA